MDVPSERIGEKAHTFIFAKRYESLPVVDRLYGCRVVFGDIEQYDVICESDSFKAALKIGNICVIVSEKGLFRKRMTTMEKQLLGKEDMVTITTQAKHEDFLDRENLLPWRPNK